MPHEATAKRTRVFPRLAHLGGSEHNMMISRGMYFIISPCQRGIAFDVWKCWARLMKTAWAGHLVSRSL